MTPEKPNRARFYQITMTPQHPVDDQALKRCFDKALDWVRYMPNCWIVKSTANPETWYARLKQVLGPDDPFLIVRIDPAEHQGYLPTWVWDWLRHAESRRSRWVLKTGRAAEPGGREPVSR